MRVVAIRRDELGLSSRLLRPLAICICGLLLAGCNGGTVDRHALRNDGATLDSIACEGALLAADVARGRTTTYFAREQAEELRVESSNFADALSRRKALVIAALLLFGAKRLPEIGRSLGHGMREFKESVTTTTDSHHEEIRPELPPAIALPPDHERSSQAA